MPSNVEEVVIKEDEESYWEDDDNPICDLCGNYYCPCCGCDCWMNDDEE